MSSCVASMLSNTPMLLSAKITASKLTHVILIGQYMKSIKPSIIRQETLVKIDIVDNLYQLLLSHVLVVFMRLLAESHAFLMELRLLSC